jgi:hypothetical protein
MDKPPKVVSPHRQRQYDVIEKVLGALSEEERKLLRDYLRSGGQWQLMKRLKETVGEGND